VRLHKIISCVFSALLLLGMTGCSTTAASASAEASQLVQPSAQCRTALTQTVTTALGYPVELAENALLNSSALLIERKRSLGPDGQKAVGKDFEIPEKFSLTGQPQCTLKHERTGKQYKLEACNCAATKPV
jgi:hypothetical protein